MDNLFGDLGIPEIRESTKKTDYQVRIDEAWDEWVDVTERPARKTPPDRFVKAVKSEMEKGISQERILRRIRAAARVNPYGRDPEDLGRVCSVLTNKNKERVADSLLQSDSPAILWRTEEEIELLSTVGDLEEYLGTLATDWHPQEHNVAGSIMESLTSDELKKAAKAVKKYLGEKSLMPSEITRYSWVWRNADTGQRKVKESNNRDAYGGGKQEAETLSTHFITSDDDAEKLMLKGFDLDIVVKFHLEAPLGYWERVDQLLDDGTTTSNAKAYHILEREYDWHPSFRDLPRR